MDNIMHVQGLPGGCCHTFDKDINGNLHTFIQTCLCPEIIPPEECGFLAVAPTVPV